MSWRFWQHKEFLAEPSLLAGSETSFSTIFPQAASSSAARYQARVAEDQRGRMQALAMLQCVLALLMPSVLHFSGVNSLWVLWCPLILAVIFAVCAWQLVNIQPRFMLTMVGLNVGAVPIILFVWLGLANYSPVGLIVPFVLQLMVLLLLPLKPRELALAIWFCISLAVLSILFSVHPVLDQVAAIFALTIAGILLALVAQRLQNQQFRLGAIRQHVRKNSEKMALRAEKMRRLALADGLTGLANRLNLMNKLQRLLANPARAHHSVVYLIDLDFFKTVNDQYGHAAGDAVLIECGQRFKSVVRRGDLVCRLGGDEFVIVVHELAGVEQAQNVAKKILQKLAEPLLFQGQRMPLGGSIGVAQWHVGVTTADAWLSDADDAMYQAKSAGRNQFHVSSA
ncbi:GGDEF domain-containing protein [Deefgea rivuli]|uniref:GGDEF domain-containing protein n=1 Tax=Deefgea rivuli TaxID=400948 RepID=UPI000484AC42|nr:GGDEF domain-containing protein [Deefgea rivuli]